MITSERAQFDPGIMDKAKPETNAYGLLLVLRQMIKNINTDDTHVTVSHYGVDCGGGKPEAVSDLSITAVSDKYQTAVTLTVNFIRTFDQLAGDELIDLTPAKIAKLASGSLFLVLDEDPGCVTRCGEFKYKLERFFRQQEQEETRETA